MVEEGKSQQRLPLHPPPHLPLKQQLMMTMANLREGREKMKVEDRIVTDGRGGGGVLEDN